MKFRSFSVFIITLFLISCSNERIIHLKTDDADGVSKGTAVMLNGVAVGEVTDLNLTEDRDVIVELSIDPRPRIPADTKFEIRMADILGTREISLLPGTDKEVLHHMDTITAKAGSYLFNTDSLSNNFMNVLKDVAGAIKDSVYIELKKLNEQLEEREKEGQ